MKKMNQTNKIDEKEQNIDQSKPIDDKDSKEYRGPTNDPDVTDNTAEELNRWADKLMPYQRYIMIVGFIILVLLVVYLGYARGALDVCNDLGGRLEVNILGIKCHPGHYNPQDNIIDNTIPYYTIED